MHINLHTHSVQVKQFDFCYYNLRNIFSVQMCCIISFMCSCIALSFQYAVNGQQCWRSADISCGRPLNRAYIHLSLKTGTSVTGVLGTFTPVLILLCVFFVLELTAGRWQTDGQRDRQDECCSLLGRPQNKKNHLQDYVSVVAFK